MTQRFYKAYFKAISGISAALIGGGALAQPVLAAQIVCDVQAYSQRGSSHSGINEISRSWFGTQIVIDTTNNTVTRINGNRKHKPSRIQSIKNTSNFVVYGYQQQSKTENGQSFRTKWSYRLYKDGALKAAMEIRRGYTTPLTAEGTCKS